MQHGTVKFFNEEKGFGFIIPADGGENIFIHISKLGDLIIREGDKVTFDTQEGRKGLEAVNVNLADEVIAAEAAMAEAPMAEEATEVAA